MLAGLAAESPSDQTEGFMKPSRGSGVDGGDLGKPLGAVVLGQSAVTQKKRHTSNWMRTCRPCQGRSASIRV